MQTAGRINTIKPSCFLLQIPYDDTTFCVFPGLADRSIDSVDRVLFIPYRPLFSSTQFQHHGLLEPPPV